MVSLTPANPTHARTLQRAYNKGQELCAAAWKASLGHCVMWKSWNPIFLTHAFQIRARTEERACLSGIYPPAIAWTVSLEIFAKGEALSRTVQTLALQTLA